MSPINPTQRVLPPSFVSSSSNTPSTHVAYGAEVQSVTQTSIGLVNIPIHGSHNETTVHYHGTALDPQLLETLIQTFEKSQAAQREELKTIPQPLAILGANIERFKQAYEANLKGTGERDVLSMYVPVQGIKKSEQGEEIVNLEDELEKFFASEATVFLLQGVAGTGKSTFNRHLALKKLEEYQHLSETQNDPPLVFFIELRSIKDPNERVIEQFLSSKGFASDQIEALRTHSHQRCIFIFDGYDEIKERNRNFYDLNELWQWERSKFVITSRPEYLDANYQTHFRPKGGRDGFKEAWMAPFSSEQRSHYIQNYVTKVNRQWSVEQYEQALNQLSTLGKELERPIVLRMLLQILPELRKSNQTEKALTLGAVYEHYFQHWWGNWQSRLGAIALTVEEEKARQELCEREGGFVEQGFRYIKQCAIELTKAELTFAQDSRDFERRYKEVYGAFFSNDAKVRLLCFNAPFQMKQKQHYEFSHKSMQEYLVARAICEADFEAIEANPNDVLNQLSLVKEPVILDFLVEQVKEQVQFKTYLRTWIEASKAPNADVIMGAANAMTLLVRAGVQFNHADLRGIRIAGADLSNGVFESAQLQGSDLRNVAFRTSWLREANLSGAQMEGVRFGEWPYLEEKSAVNSCAYSPDGKTCATGLNNGKISVYNTLNWKKIHTLRGHNFSVSSVVYSPSGAQIASGSSDKTVRLWDAQRGAAGHILRGHTSYVTSVVYSPSGLQLASGSYDKTVRLWDAHTGAAVHTLEGHTSAVTSVVYSPSGAQIASGSYDTTVRLWDANNGAAGHTLVGHTDSVLSVVYSPSGSQIASGSRDKTVRLWDANNGAKEHTLVGHTYGVNSVVYSLNGAQIASGSIDNTVRLWDAHAGVAQRTLKGHTDDVNSVVYSPSGAQIASGSDDNTVRLWDAHTGAAGLTLEGHIDSVYSVVYSPSGAQIASGSSDYTVRLWDAHSGAKGHTLVGHTKAVMSVVYSPSGAQIASGSYDKTVRLWDAHAGAAGHTLVGHTDSVNSVVYSPSESQIASGSYDKTVRLWDAHSGATLHTLEGHISWVNSVVYSPSGAQIVSGSRDKTVRLWDVHTGAAGHTLVGHTDSVLRVVYSPSGAQIASGSRDKTVRLWDVHTGAAGHTLVGHTDSVLRVVYSPSGAQIASGSRDKTVRLWDAHTGKARHTLEGHTYWVNSVVYSPSGSQIASSSADKTVRLWEVASGDCLREIQGFSGSVNSVAWKDTPDGSYLLTSSEDQFVRQWQVVAEGSGYNARLRWMSPHRELTVIDSVVDGVKGLSEMNIKLLNQRGARFSENRLLDFFWKNVKI